MDTNLHKLTNSTWGLDHMTMEDHILHNHQLPLDSIWHNYPLQTHELPPPSSSSQQQQVPITGVLFVDDDPMGKNQMGEDHEEEPDEELGAMKEMMYKIAAMQPVDIDPSTIQKPRRRNVRISEDPQSVAARHRRERISEKIRILQRLVPGGTKMDTASMLDEAIRYVKFLKRQIRQLQSNHHHPPCIGGVTTGGLSAQDWPWLPITSNKTLASEDPVGFTLGGSGGGGATLCFNHEVISD